MNVAAKGLVAAGLAMAGAGCSAINIPMAPDLQITQAGVLLLSCLLLLAAHGLNQLRRRAVMQRQEVMSVTVICAALPSAGARQITLERTLMANRCRRRGPEMVVKSGIRERKFSWTMTGGRRSSPRVQRQECQHQARRNARRTRWQLGRGRTEKHL